MKARTQTLIYLGLLFLIVGTVVVMMITGVPNKIVTDQVAIEPRPMDLSNAGVMTVQVKLYNKKVMISDQIDNTTVVLEGIFVPFKTWVEEPGPHTTPGFYAQFDGQSMVPYIIHKILHMNLMGPYPKNPIQVPLMISGLLLEEYGSTPWEGTGYAKVYPSTMPPPPPPPL